MNPRLGLVVALTALLALGIGVFFRSGGESPEGSARATITPSVEAGADDPGEPSTALPDAAGVSEGGRESVPEAALSVAAADVAAARSLRVRVLDASEQPVEGIEVQLVQRIEPWNRIEQRATTTETGIATFGSVGMAAANGSKPLGDVTPVIHVAALVAERVEVLLEESMFGREEPVTLRLPPTGSIDVHVFDVEPGPPLGDVTVELVHVPKGEAREVSLADSFDRASVTATAKDGVARFPFVACGIEVNAVAARDGNEASCSAAGPGPRRPGQVVRLEVRFGEGHPVVQLRAVDSAGVPFAESEFSVDIETATRIATVEREISPRSDEDGRLRVDLEHEPNKKVTRSLTIRGPQRPSDSGRPIAHVVLPKALPEGLTDLGDVTLGVAPLFVAGLVVDDTGRALPGLELELQRRGDAIHGLFRKDPEFDARSDDDGRFEVYGTRPGAAFRLAAQSPDHSSRFVEFEPGAPDVLLELAQPGGIAGRLLLDPGVEPTTLTLILLDRPTDEFVDRDAMFVTPAADGSFSFENLLAGSGRRLGVRSRSVHSELLTVDDLEVVAGRVQRDPRINPLDLRGRLFQHELVPIGTETAGFSAGGQIYFGAVGADSLEYAGNIGLVPLTIAAPFERIDLKVKYNGFRTIDLTNVGGRIELEMRESLEVTFVLLGGAKLPEPPIFVKVGLVPAGGGREDLALNGEPFDERRELSTAAPGAGRMEVRWVLERRGSDGRSWMTVVPPEPHYVDVLEGVEGQRFEITVTQEELDEIVSRLPY